MTTYVCPVLFFDATVEGWLRSFAQLYRLEPFGATLRWVRAAWPVAGGLEDQPSLLLDVLEFMARLLNQLPHEEAHQRQQREQIRAERRAALASLREAEARRRLVTGEEASGV